MHHHAFSSSRRSLLAAALSASWLSWPRRAPATPALSLSAEEPAPYTPTLGQMGKDVMWLPTPDAVVQRMLQLAQLKAGDTLLDLGSGDGKLVIAAARDFGAQARGVEYDARLVALARHMAEQAGVAHLTHFEEGDLFEADLSQASVIALYLLPLMNLRLRPSLLAQPPGTRIVTHQFLMGDWLPDESSEVQYRTAHVWVVPANAGGRWTLRLPSGDMLHLELAQTFQQVSGTITQGALQTSLRAPRLLGRHLRFAWTDVAGRLREAHADLSDGAMHGVIDGVNFVAKRLNAAPAIGGAGPATLAEERAAGALLGDM